MGLPPVDTATGSLLLWAGFSPPTSFSLDASFLGGWGFLKESFVDDMEGGDVAGASFASTGCMTNRSYYGNKTAQHEIQHFI